MRTNPRAVVYISNSAKIGGGNHALMDLVAGIDRDRFRPVLVVPGDGPLVEWARSSNVPFYIVPDAQQVGRVAFIRQVLMLARLMRRERAALVHAFAPPCYRAASIAGSLVGVKRICHIQFPPGAEELSWSFRFGVDAVVTCYGQLAGEIRKTFASGAPVDVVAISNAVDLVRFAPSAPDEHQESSAWRKDASHLVVIVGHLSEVKGYPAFLEAAQAISRRLPRCRFLAVGNETLTAGYGALLNERVQQLDLGHAVQFVGWRDDIPEILRAADVMVLPSLAEGLPLSVLEAMACGRPVVATAVNGTPEAVVHGTTGLLIKPNSSAELADAVLELLANRERAERMGAAGRARVAALFPVERMVSGVHDLYERLLGRGAVTSRTPSHTMPARSV